MNPILLRDVIDSDLPIFFEHQLDADANHMVAFGAKDPADRDAFMAKWETKILGGEMTVKRTILHGENVAGFILCFEHSGQREVGYWIGKEFWGKGVATRALAQFLLELPTRPLFARAARDNLASIRVLEKCGFALIGYDRGFANGRGMEIEEVVLKLS
jgi:RimJ/RimL family protein N-acetyltransferase